MTNLTNMRIGKRLAVGFGVSAVLMLVMAIVAWWGMATRIRRQTAVAKSAENRSLAQAVLTDVVSVRGIILGMAQQTTPEGKAQYQKELDEVRAVYGKRLQELRAAADTEAGSSSWPASRPDHRLAHDQ